MTCSTRTFTREPNVHTYGNQTYTRVWADRPLSQLSVTARLVEVQASQGTKVRNCIIAANVGNCWQAYCPKMDQFAGKWKLLEEYESVRHNRSLREGVKTHSLGLSPK